MKIRVADYVVRRIEQAGTDRLFLLSGGGMMHLVDAAGQSRRLQLVFGHHEHACAVAAEGYARQTGRLGACFVTSGPGGTNAVTGVAECWQDSVPVLFVSGQSKVSQTIRGSGIKGLRQFGTFEVDILPIIASITKYAAFVDDPRDIRVHLDRAIEAALSGRPGPVFLDIPVDVQGALIDPEGLPHHGKGVRRPAPPLSVSKIDEVVAAMKRASRPLILAGHGIRAGGHVTAFREVVRRLNIPVITTQLGADILPYDSRLFVGHPGMKGDRAGNFAVQTTDALLCVGTSLHVLTTGYELDRFAPEARKIMVDPDPAVLRRERVGVKVKLHAEIGAFLSLLAKRVGGRGPLVPTGDWHSRCSSWKDRYSVDMEPHAHEAGRLNFYQISAALSEASRGDETIVSDAGSAFYVIGQAFRFRKGQRLISSGAMGAMGHALPLAIGAAEGKPRGKVVCVTGDGSLQTNIQELAVLAERRPNLLCVVVNNGGYVSIRNTQNSFFQGRLVGTDSKHGVVFPKLKQVAEAYGLRYKKTATRCELDSFLKNAAKQPGPLILEVMASRDQQIIPMVSSLKLKDGTMQSKPLEDMYPFLSPERVREELVGNL